MLNMARIMGEVTVCSFIFVFILFDLVIETKMAVHGNSHDFIPTDNEVRYVVDGVPMHVHKELNSGAPGVRLSNIEENSVLNSLLKFEPPLLDFKKRHLGIPHHEKVTLFNINKNQTIHMSSISGNTVHFHSSFFEDKVIPPLGNTTFNVVFLGREEGEIESSLFIHTSEGSFKYGVRGSSVGSPYRLRPLVGARVPLNSTFSPLIYMHNPHSTPMQIVEIYSSGGEFHLELPSGELEGPKHLWEIPPYHTKPVIRVRFVANTEKNHTAYIRIKVNNSEEVLVVPLEVEVDSHHGLFYAENVIDFGVGGSLDPPARVKLLLHNSWKKAIRVAGVAAQPATRAVRVDFLPVKVPPDSEAAVEVATITFDWKAAYDSNQLSGKLVIKSNHSQYKLVIPYTATVLEGRLLFNASTTQYCSGRMSTVDTRNFTVVNSYRLPVAISEVSLPQHAQAYFSIQNFTWCVIRPGHAVTLFRLELIRDRLSPDLKLDTFISLHTNVSTILVPLFYYSGQLTQVIPSVLNETFLNVGLVGSGATKHLRFALFNDNPVSVDLREWGTNLTSAALELLGVKTGNKSAIFPREDHVFDPVDSLSHPVLQPGQYAVFRLAVTAPYQDGRLEGEVFVLTQYERVSVRVCVRVAVGGLEVLPAPTADCFPGRLCVRDLEVRSMFARPMTVTHISAPLVRFSLQQPTLVAPLSTSLVGRASFDPALLCGEDCYLGSSTAVNKWIHTLSLPANTYKSDVSLFNALYDKYISQTAKSPWHNITVKLDTTEVRDFTFDISFRMTWPELMPDVVNSSTVLFPLTQIGGRTVEELRLTNPSSHPLSVQLVLEWVYLQDGKKMIGAPGRFENLFRDLHNVTPWDFDMDTVHATTPHDTLTLLLAPGESMKVRLGFVPRKAGLSSALLFVRNNLTILDIVRLTGKAVEAQFKFGNRKPGSGTPLMFELAEKHLKDCERERNRKVPVPNLTVKRSFTARNTGELTIHVLGFSINALPCEGYGFRVLNCEPFHLPPNATRKVDIAFTPDFTLARIQRTLTIETSLGVPVNYTLITTLPPFFLASCSSVLGRPSWEPMLYYVAVSFMVFLLSSVLAAAFLESDRILKCALMAMAKDRISRSNTEYKPIFADVHKTIEKMKQSCETAEQFPNSSSKPPKERESVKSNSWVMADDRRLSVGKERERESQKGNSWATVEDRRDSLGSEQQKEQKEQMAMTQKFDDAEGTAAAPAPSQVAPIKLKRKLGKRYSTNSDAACEPMQETPSSKKGYHPSGGKLKVLPPTLTPPEAENKPHPTQAKDNVMLGKKPQESRKEAKRLGRLNKGNKKSKPVVCPAEEESSSSTTDSSNNEEMEKERESSGTSLSERAHKSTPKKAKGKAVDYRDNYEGDCDDDDYEGDALKRRWKPAPAPPTPLEVAVKPEAAPKPLLPFKLKANNTNRDRKDKNALKRGSTADKTNIVKPMMSTAPEVCHVAPVRISPPPRPSNLWTENRASFSDVVARNDSPSYSTVVAPRKPSLPPPPPPAKLPPIKQSPKLGPIGPKKGPPGAWEPVRQQPESNSLFSNLLFHDSPPPQPQQQQQQQPIEGSTQHYAADPWRHQGVLRRQEEHMRRQMEQYRQHIPRQESWAGSLWDPLHMPPSTPLFPSHHMEQQQQQQQQQHSGGLWWNSTVASTWPSPWSEAPPPGLTAANQAAEAEPRLDTGPTYDPFRSLNNIWTPHSSDPWNNSRNE